MMTALFTVIVKRAPLITAESVPSPGFAAISACRSVARRLTLSCCHWTKSAAPNCFPERFTVGTDASAAWGNGKSAHEDPSTRIVFYGHTKGMFAGFGLDGARLSSATSPATKPYMARI